MAEKKIKELIETKYQKLIENENSIRENSNNGINSVAFFDTVLITGIKREEFAKLLGSSTRSMIRYKNSNKDLNHILSEKILKILYLYNYGIEILGNIDEVREWIKNKTDSKEVEFLKTNIGIDRLINDLKRIEYGDI